jgi:hypothetical protein
VLRAHHFVPNRYFGIVAARLLSITCGCDARSARGWRDAVASRRGVARAIRSHPIRPTSHFESTKCKLISSVASDVRVVRHVRCQKIGVPLAFQLQTKKPLGGAPAAGLDYPPMNGSLNTGYRFFLTSKRPSGRFWTCVTLDSRASSKRPESPVCADILCKIYMVSRNNPRLLRIAAM